MSDVDGAEKKLHGRARRFVSLGLVGLALTAALGAIAARAGGAREAGGEATPAESRKPQPIAAPVAQPERAPEAAPPATRPRVELVFALDTTGSMGALIEGAKRKIWSLASFVAQGKPTPDLRVGLVAYRDVGDAYVTRRFDLDGDLDRVHRRLRTFAADGGGDGPEHVARALHEAVHRMSWSPGPEVVKVVYLVGDAPPHTDYQDGYDYERAARVAAARGIQVHTIRCGGDPTTEAVWRRIAALGRGQFMSVEQDGGMREDRTPYDEELARLHDELSDTSLAYGAHREAVRGTVATAKAEAPAVKAERARFMAHNRRALSGEGDLVDDVASGAVRIEALAPTDLPADIRRLPVAEQKLAIERAQRQRDEIRGQIDGLMRKRDAHLEAQTKAAARAGLKDGFDLSARKALQKSVADNALSGLKL